MIRVVLSIGLVLSAAFPVEAQSIRRNQCRTQVMCPANCEIMNRSDFCTCDCNPNTTRLLGAAINAASDIGGPDKSNFDRNREALERARQGGKLEGPNDLPRSGLGGGDGGGFGRGTQGGGAGTQR